MFHAVLGMVLVLSADVPERPLELADRKPTGNYWVLLRSLYEEAERSPERRQKVIEERMRSLRASDLIRAAQRAAEEALQQYSANVETAYKEGQARMHLCFEYYPMLAEAPKDFNALVELLQTPGTPGPLLCFLLREMAPEPALDSAFSSYFRRCLRRSTVNPLEMAQFLLIARRNEPQVALAALEVSMNLLRRNYAELLESVPAWSEWMRALGQPPSPKLFLAPGLPQAGAGDLQRLSALNVLAADFAALCDRSQGGAPAAVKETASRMAKEIRGEFPVNRQEEAAPKPAPEATPVIPGIPAEFFSNKTFQ